MFGLTEYERRRALARVERISEWPLTILAIALTGMILMPYVTPLRDSTRVIFGWVALAIWVVFLVDLGLRVLLAPNRVTYLLRNWPDLLMVLLPPLRIGWAVAGVIRGVSGLRRIVSTESIGVLALTVVPVVLLAAALVLQAEEDSPTRTIGTYEDAVWWAMATVTTVGYGDMYPTTTAGRGIGILLMATGIALFFAAASRVGAMFIGEQENAFAQEAIEFNERLDRLERQIADLSNLIQRGQGGSPRSSLPPDPLPLDRDRLGPPD
jgi:voltage-gated potassium channel